MLHLSVITETLGRMLLVSGGLKSLLVSWSTNRAAEFTAESRELSSTDSVQGSSDGLRVWMMVTFIKAARLYYSLFFRGSVCSPQLTWNWFEEASSPITSPCDGNTDDSLICYNYRPLTYYYFILFSVDTQQKHTYDVRDAPENASFVLKRERSTRWKRLLLFVLKS